MKPVLSYYGGKQRLVPDIIPLIPHPSTYVQWIEAFCGGAAVTFHKPQSENEVINDIDGRLTNFYWQLKTNFHELQKLVQATLHSEIHYLDAEKVLEDESETPVRRAWAYWVRTQMAFSFILGGGFAFGETGSGQNTANKRDNFTDKYMERMRTVEVFNRNAVDLIKTKDSPNSVIFCDPPYASSDQGGYKGYTLDHFKELLDTLASIKGKFILTSYPEEILMEYRQKYNWYAQDKKQIVQVSGKREVTKYKWECITLNYIPAQLNLLNLFESTTPSYTIQESNSK